jgi:hypothetical protein
MANIFKTTLKKEIITDIVDNNKREIRFPLTKFWASRFAENYNLDEKTFEFRTFDSLELSSPSNKETDGVTYTFDYIRTTIDGDEFIIEFKESDNEIIEELQIEDETQLEIVENQYQKEIKSSVELEEDKTTISEEINFSEEILESTNSTIVEYDGEFEEIEEDKTTISEEINFSEEILESTNSTVVECDGDFEEIEEIEEDNGEQPFDSNYDVFALIKQWLKNEMILDDFYEDESVFATNARQVIVLPKGKPLGFKKRLPVNNDVEVRIEFDKNEKIYFDLNPDFELFEEAITKRLTEIRKNNFVFVWKQYTGIFMDNSGRIYFGMKYSTRSSIGFNRKYNVQ